MSEDDIIQTYLDLKEQCLTNPAFVQLLKNVEDDIFSSIKESPQAATEAHYRLLALEAIRGKLLSVEVSYEQVRQRIESEGHTDY